MAFFWLLGTLCRRPRVSRVLAWALVLCSIPLAATGLKNYLSGGFLSTGVPGFQRIYGYKGGSGIAGNPNDLALMLNLIIPIAGGAAPGCTARGDAVDRRGALVLSAIAVIVTFSRAGFLTLAATFVMFLVVLALAAAPWQGDAAAGGAGFRCWPSCPRATPIASARSPTSRADRTGSAEGRWQDFQIALDIVSRASRSSARASARTFWR